MNTLIQIIRIVISAIVGYFTVKYFNIENSFLSILFYFAVYIAVSMTIELLRKKRIDLNKKN